MQSANQTPNHSTVLRNQRGQGLIEYLIIVAMMGVATIAIVRVMSQTVATRFAKVTLALQGKTAKSDFEEVKASLYKKKDLGNFFNGAGAKGGNQNGAQNDQDSGQEE